MRKVRPIVLGPAGGDEGVVLVLSERGVDVMLTLTVAFLPSFSSMALVFSRESTLFSGERRPDAMEKGWFSHGLQVSVGK